MRPLSLGRGGGGENKRKRYKNSNLQINYIVHEAAAGIQSLDTAAHASWFWLHDPKWLCLMFYPN